MISQLPSLHAEPAPLFADIIVPRHLAGPFTYIIPSSLRTTVRVGHRVLVPFGKVTLQGAVIALSTAPPQGLNRARLREIHALLPDETATDMTANLFQLSRQVAEQYIAPWGQCLRLVLPPTLKPQKPIIHYELTELGKLALAGRKTCTTKERALLNRLATISHGKRQSSRNSTLINSLHDLTIRGWVMEVQAPPAVSNEVPAPLLAHTSQNNSDDIAATLLHAPAESWALPLFTALNTTGPSRILIQAPWADRLRLLRQTVHLLFNRGRAILILVGETERAEWIASLLRDEKRGIFPVWIHSGLSEHKKSQIWDQIYRQTVRIVVGTRSSVFIPLTAIGAIWVEGEEDTSFKEPQEPRYHARDVAWLRAQSERTILILSSSHPSLETRSAVEQNGVFLSNSLPNDMRPHVQIIDLRKHPYGTVLSQPLVQAMGQAISRKARILLFLNRKGYAGALVCRDCGQVPRCAACHVALMYSRQSDCLQCSYCGNRSPIPDTCATCCGPRMQLIGEGTERVEDDARRLFPHARVIRIDGNTMRTTARAETLWKKIDQGEWDIIVGTQLLLRRGPLPTMGLVGVVQADAGLSVPDFRSAERTYHMLLDAAALVEPAGSGGHIIIQTALSPHHAIQAVAQNNELLFLSEELSHRTALGYPPAVHLISLFVSGTDETMVHRAAVNWAALLTAHRLSSLTEQPLQATPPARHLSLNPLNRLTVLGPVPSPVAKLRGRHRWHILVKSLDRDEGLETVRATVKEMERTHQRHSIQFNIDVDPMEMW